MSPASPIPIGVPVPDPLFPYAPFQLLKLPYRDPFRLPEDEFPLELGLEFRAVIESELGVDVLGRGNTKDPEPDAARVEVLAAIAIG